MVGDIQDLVGLIGIDQKSMKNKFFFRKILELNFFGGGLPEGLGIISESQNKNQVRPDLNVRLDFPLGQL